jgi:hypothetical protein
MKYSNYIGVAAAVALIVMCFLPWVVIPTLNVTLTGLNSEINKDANFGRQIIPHAFFCIVMSVCFLLPYVSVKRANVLFGAIHFAWAIKNYYVFTTCRLGDCPEKKIGIYGVVLFAFIMLIMSFLPKLKVKNQAL